MEQQDYFRRLSQRLLHVYRSQEIELKSGDEDDGGGKGEDGDADCEIRLQECYEKMSDTIEKHSGELFMKINKVKNDFYDILKKFLNTSDNFYNDILHNIFETYLIDKFRLDIVNINVLKGRIQHNDTVTCSNKLEKCTKLVEKLPSMLKNKFNDNVKTLITKISEQLKIATATMPNLRDVLSKLKSDLLRVYESCVEPKESEMTDSTDSTDDSTDVGGDEGGVDGGGVKEREETLSVKSEDDQSDEEEESLSECGIRLQECYEKMSTETIENHAEQLREGIQKTKKTFFKHIESILQTIVDKQLYDKVLNALNHVFTLFINQIVNDIQYYIGKNHDIQYYIGYEMDQEEEENEEEDSSRECELRLKECTDSYDKQTQKFVKEYVSKMQKLENALRAILSNNITVGFLTNEDSIKDKAFKLLQQELIVLVESYVPVMMDPVDGGGERETAKAAEWAEGNEEEAESYVPFMMDPVYAPFVMDPDGGDEGGIVGGGEEKTQAVEAKETKEGMEKEKLDPIDRLQKKRKEFLMNRRKDEAAAIDRLQKKRKEFLMNRRKAAAMLRETIDKREQEEKARGLLGYELPRSKQIENENAIVKKKDEERREALARGFGDAKDQRERMEQKEIDEFDLWSVEEEMKKDRLPGRRRLLSMGNPSTASKIEMFQRAYAR